MRNACIICCESFLRGDSDALTALSCGHVFHIKCADMWFMSQNHLGTYPKARTCPNCRTPVDTKRIIEKLYFEFADNTLFEKVTDNVDMNVSLKENEDIDEQPCSSDSLHENITQYSKKSSMKEFIENTTASIDSLVSRLKKSKLETLLYKQQLDIMKLKLDTYKGSGKLINCLQKDCLRLKRNNLAFTHIKRIMDENVDIDKVIDIMKKLGNMPTFIRAMHASFLNFKKETLQTHAENKRLREFHQKQLRKESLPNDTPIIKPDAEFKSYKSFSNVLTDVQHYLNKCGKKSNPILPDIKKQPTLTDYENNILSNQKPKYLFKKNSNIKRARLDQNSKPSFSGEPFSLDSSDLNIEINLQSPIHGPNIESKIIPCQYNTEDYTKSLYNDGIKDFYEKYLIDSNSYENDAPKPSTDKPLPLNEFNDNAATK
ncbi:hypothetical protein A3Q56_00666 [Intoshia linei]|uniref:RING-type domain-containing protein n=1 Tax=Intoshia linei TaxID=1819745 RepID=A0A177BB83_9BILA|nr:hypothetical protein A3Q56_00666 [Intoshia linei]